MGSRVGLTYHPDLRTLFRARLEGSRNLAVIVRWKYSGLDASIRVRSVTSLPAVGGVLSDTGLMPGVAEGLALIGPVDVEKKVGRVLSCRGCKHADERWINGESLCMAVKDRIKIGAACEMVDLCDRSGLSPMNSVKIAVSYTCLYVLFTVSTKIVRYSQKFADQVRFLPRIFNKLSVIDKLSLLPF